MACGSVAQVDIISSLTFNGVGQGDLLSPSEPLYSSKTPTKRQKSVPEAVAFLQKEHDIVLSGLHEEVERLQQKCEELQFNLHLKHLSNTKEDELTRKVQELEKALEAKNFQIEYGDKRFEEQERLHDSEREQWQWKELNLRQQIEVSNHRQNEMKDEIRQLRGQVQNLKVFNSAVRKANGSCLKVSPPSGPRSMSSMSKVSSLYKSSQESLDSCGPLSFGSEEGDPWKEAKPCNANRLISVKNSKTALRFSSSLPPLYPIQRASRSLSSTSNVISLPPITQGQSSLTPRGQSRGLVRRQLRLLSAPSLDSNSTLSRIHQ